MNVESIKHRVRDKIETGSRTEGKTTKALEKTAAAIPSGTFLLLAGAALGCSIGLRVSGRKHAALFVGEWVPTILMLGLYNKIVKVLGSERDSVKQPKISEDPAAQALRGDYL